MKKDENYIDVNKWLKDTPVSCKYGAPLGDNGTKGPMNDNYRFSLQKLKMVDGCYDLAGTYWGQGVPLYGYMGYSEEQGFGVRGFVRATSRAEAKQQIKDSYPKARFYS